MSAKHVELGSIPTAASILCALLAELADAPDSKPGAFGRIGSTPIRSTNFMKAYARYYLFHGRARYWMHVHSRTSGRYFASVIGFENRIGSCASGGRQVSSI